MGQVTQTLPWKTEVGDVGLKSEMLGYAYGRSLENIMLRKYAIMITQITHRGANRMEQRRGGIVPL